MENSWKNLLLFILSGVLCFGADHRAVLRAHQSSDGLWRDTNGVDMIGTLFALTALETSSAPEDIVATQSARAAIYLNGQDDGSLLGSLPFLLASQSDDIFQLSFFHDEEGWIQEAGAPADKATTLLMLLLSPTNEFTRQDLAFLANETSSDNIRYSLLLLFSFLRHRLHPPEEMLQLLDNLSEEIGFFEQALALFSLAKLSQWDDALKLRERLLASQLPEGGWNEADGLPFDLVTTSLAILALDCFHVSENTIAPDLCLEESTTSLRFDSDSTLLSTVVSNKGTVAASNFKIIVSALTETDTLPLESTTVSYLNQGSSQQLTFQLEIPDECTAILLEADQKGTTGDSQRENNYLLIPLSDTLPSLHLGQMLFDWRKPDYPYYLNPGFGAVASISIFCPNPSTPLRWKWLCDGSVFSTGGIDTPNALKPLPIQVDCFPAKGVHTISIQVTQTIGEASYTVEASLDIQVLYDSCALFCRHVQENENHSDHTFAAREEILFETFSSNPDASASISIFDASGAYIGNAVAEKSSGKYRWNTEASTPGLYKVIAEFWDFDTMEMPSKAECFFEITPSSASANLIIRTVTEKNSGIRFYEGMPCSPLVSLTWETAANTSTTCQISWEIHDEMDSIVAQSNTPDIINANLNSLRQWHLLSLDDIVFAKAATYTVHIQLAANEQTLNASHTLTVSKRPGIICENKLYSPKGESDEAGRLCLPAPDGTATPITDILRIKLQDDALSLPCSFQCEASPIALNDAPDNAILITLDGVVNAFGNTIQSGWLVCQTPYGVLTGENDLTPNWKYGGTVAIPIHEGTASFTYLPQGETPYGIKHIVPIEIFPYQENDFYDRIGTIEILLSNQL
ncbi:MAG: hypothetical protein IKP00_05035 [Victivallales bacterium]|nr:hypothetical protein [Victivallales bacterium]